MYDTNELMFIERSMCQSTDVILETVEGFSIMRVLIVQSLTSFIAI